MNNRVHVAALTKDDKLVVLRMSRPGIDVPTFEFPGGEIKPGETPEKAAARELMEKAKHSSSSFEFIGEVPLPPRIELSSVKVYFAKNAVAGVQNNPGVETVTVAEALAACSDTQIPMDALTVSSLKMIIAKHPELST